MLSGIALVGHLSLFLLTALCRNELPGNLSHSEHSPKPGTNNKDSWVITLYVYTAFRLPDEIFFFFLPGYIRILFLFTSFGDTTAMLCDMQLAGNRDLQDDDASGVKACLLAIFTYQRSTGPLPGAIQERLSPFPRMALLFKNNAFPTSLYRRSNCFWVIRNSNHADFKVRQAGIESQFGFSVAGAVQSVNLPLVVFRTGIPTRKAWGCWEEVTQVTWLWGRLGDHLLNLSRGNQTLIPLDAF